MKKVLDKRLLWKRWVHYHKLICKQKTADLKLSFIFSTVRLLIHKTQTVVITSRLTEYCSWGIFHPLTGLSLFMKITLLQLLLVNWNPNGRCYGKLLPHAYTHTNQKEQCNLPNRHELCTSLRIEQWGLCKNNTVAKGLVSLILHRKENFSGQEHGQYCGIR